MSARPMRSAVVVTVTLATLMVVSAAAAQDDGPPRRTGPTSGTTAWFGLPLPPKPGSIPAVVAGTRGPRPVTLPPGEPAAPEFQGATIRKDLEQLVAIAKESQANKEIGTGQIWGRIAGFPSGVKTAAWSAEQFTRAGIADVKIQPITQDADASFWLPLSWEVKLLGDAALGAGTRRPRARIGDAAVAERDSRRHAPAPLVYVGNGSPAMLEHIDVKGKIAVQLGHPAGAHGVRARLVGAAGAGALQARGGRRVQSDAPAGQRDGARLQQLRRSVREHRRPRRLLPRERAREGRRGQGGGQTARAHHAEDAGLQGAQGRERRGR